MNFYQLLQRYVFSIATFASERQARRCALITAIGCVAALTHANASGVALHKAVGDSVTAPLPGQLEQLAYQSDGQAIVILGDSISAGYGIQRDQGWVHLLDQTLAQREESWYAVNASISGETTGGGRARLQGILDEHAPGIVIIELGGNDGLRGWPCVISSGTTFSSAAGGSTLSLLPGRPANAARWLSTS